jgi:hypothetical protein
MLLSRHSAASTEYRMSNESKNANMNERGGTGKNDANRPNDTTQKSGQQSQDASRHQQDAAHHKSDKARSEALPIPRVANKPRADRRNRAAE